MKDELIIVDQLTGRQLAGLITPAEEQELNEIITRDQEAFMFWETKKKIHESELRKQLNNEFDESATYLRLWDNIGRRTRIRRIKTYGIAAGIVFMIGLGFATLFRSQPTKNQELIAKIPAGSIQLTVPGGNIIDLSATQGQVIAGNAVLNNKAKTLSYTITGEPAAGSARLTVPVGKDYHLQLSDGTEVWVNSATTVDFPFTFTEDRQISITGEAYIKVAPDAHKPFSVQLPSGLSVQVLGTEFNVNTYKADKPQVALVAGAVRLEADGMSVQLKPGFEGVYSKGSSFKVDAFDEDYTLSWRRGVFKFEAMPLKEVCQVLPRWFGVTTVMDNDRIADKRFTGILDRNKPLQAQLTRFSESEEVEYYFDNGVLHFK